MIMTRSSFADRASRPVFPLSPLAGLAAAIALIALVAAALPAASSAGSFGTARNFPAGSGPASVVIGQFSADLKRDLALSNGFGVSMLPGNGAGGFGTPRDFAKAGGSGDLAVGRFNADGFPDLVVAGPDTNVSVLLGNGAGSFGTATTWSTGPEPRWGARSVSVGDMNGDTVADVVATSAEGVSVLLGNGDGTFTAPLTRDVGGIAPEGLALGDFNGDSNLDAVYGTGAAGNYVGVLLGSGDGTFASSREVPAGAVPMEVAVGFLNRDRNLDIAATNARSNSVSVVLGRGDGTFGGFRSFGASNRAVSGPAGLAIGDLNRDSRADLVVANSDANDVGVLVGYGNGIFGALRNYPTGRTPTSVAIGNLNAGSDPDLAVSNLGSNNVSVLLNAGPSPRRITLAFNKDRRRFSGRITSADPTCVRSQRVTVLKRRRGPDRQIRAVNTNRSGYFRFGYGIRPGAYYARVRAWSACRFASSKVVRVRR
jgi:hypothetical protein